MEIIIVLQSVVAFGTGIVSLYLVYRILQAYLKKLFRLNVQNEAYAVFKAGVLISTSLLMSSVISPESMPSVFSIKMEYLLPVSPVASVTYLFFWL